MITQELDFYDKTALKTYNLPSAIQYQLGILDRFDRITRIHSENVASLVCRIGEYLHCSKDFIAYCTMCAYVHDIGKVKVPLEILNKPGKLTDAEYEIMKKHTLYGFDICMKSVDLRPYALGAKYHHEALDGSGYPEGLKGRQIPYEDQIIRVADEFDAIVAKRQYTTHINISETLRELMGETAPEEIKHVIALDNEAQEVKVGKINRKIVRALFRVVIDDTEYEITCTDEYIKSLKQEVKRLSLILNYETKAEKARTQKKKHFFEEGMRLLFGQGETPENYKQILMEYQKIIDNKQEIIKKLYEEIHIIKKLKV